MTAITLNLLAEEQLAQKAEARDPFKVALVIGIGLCAVFVVAGTLLAQAAGKSTAEANSLQTRLDSLSARTDITGDGTKTVKLLADDIIAMNQARRMYAQQLALIKDLVPDSIQIDRIGFTLNVEASAPAVADASPGTTEEGKTKTRAQRPASVERLTLQLSGFSISSRPEIEVDQFIQAMGAHEGFSAQIKGVNLRSIARNAAVTGKRGAELPSASFVIECQYKDRK